MRTNLRTRALVVVGVAAVAVILAGSQAFGATGGGHFHSSPSQARFGHLPNVLNNRSVTRCAPGAPVTVALMRGTTTYATASTTAGPKGKWAVFMSIPANLTPGLYAVTARCGGASPRSYKPQNFRVTPTACPTGTTTSPTTVQCRVPPSSTSTTVPTSTTAP